MNKILLALILLGAGTGGFLTTRQATTQLQHEANAAREAWLAQTQLVAVAQSDQAGLTEHVRELKQALRQAAAPRENALWSALQTNRSGQLAPELREQVLEELGFNWQFSEEFIVISKEALREYYIRIKPIENDKLTDVASTVLALTPGERGQVEAAIQRVRAEFKDWALAHVERTEPKDDVVAQYTLTDDPAMFQSISNNFVAGVFDALGKERAELIRFSAGNWFVSDIGLRGYSAKLVIKRVLVGNEQRLKVQMQGGGADEGYLPLPWNSFPAALRPIFPNGWADVAQREGFELPPESQKK